VSEEDGEAIANVEKLTGMKIPVYEMGGEQRPAEEPAPKADKPRRAEKSRDEAKPRREEKPPRAEVKREEPKREGPKREEKPARSEARPEKPREERRPEPKREKAPADDAQDSDDGGWNGPVPGFLGFSAD